MALSLTKDSRPRKRAPIPTGVGGVMELLASLKGVGASPLLPRRPSLLTIPPRLGTLILMRCRVIIFSGVTLAILAAHATDFNQRQPNTSLALPLSPPAFGFATTNAFPGLAFADPVAIATPPGETNRLFVVEQAGRIVVITNLGTPTRTVFLDIRSQVVSGGEQGLLGLAFHPQYAVNRQFYVFYTLSFSSPAGSGLHNRISRFEASSDNPNLALPASELPLLNQRDEAGNHNGGDLHFGPDGYLYVGLGDEGGGNDQYNNSQRIDKDFFAGIIRLDVDRRPGSLAPNPHPAATPHYAVPADNPWVGATNFIDRPVNPAQVRTEFWAVGLRNPWRLSFDPRTGWLYCGDVGQGAREEINWITRGGNYGWAFREGTIAGPRTPPAGFSSLRPIAEYSHGSGTNQGRSVTGGVVYRGNQLSQLYGAYVFADYVSGNLWSITFDGQSASPMRRLTQDPGIATFGTDPRSGEVLFGDLAEDQVKRLVYNTNLTGAPLPPTLADTGAFADLASLQPYPGILPYELNVPFWSDGAAKQRWFSIPNLDARIGFNTSGNWAFPDGTVWVKHFELEMTNGVPSSKRRLETRFIVKNRAGVYGITYRWDDAQTNATLVPEQGLDEALEIHEATGVRTQTWRYPSRAECLACHTPAGGYALGFNTAQLNRDVTLNGTPENQLRWLDRLGYFQANLTRFHLLPALAPASDTNTSREYRVRSYLAANCAQCHQPGSTGVGLFDARATTPTDQASLILGPLNDTADDPDSRVIVPGSPTHSMLLTRISSLGPTRMPPMASSVLDQEAIDLLRAWITNDLPNYRSLAQWQTDQFGSTTDPRAQPAADPDLDHAPNQQEYLAGTDPLNPAQAWGIAIVSTPSPKAVTLRFSRAANRAYEIQTVLALDQPISWESMDIPENRPWFPTSTGQTALRLPITNTAPQFYRVQFRAP